MTDTNPVAGERRWRLAERGAWATGVVLLVAALAGYAHRHVGASADIAAFESGRASVAASAAPMAMNPAAVQTLDPAALARMEAQARPDHSTWSPGRIEGYREALGLDRRVPLAMLRIPSVGVEVAVLPGTDEITLNRGVGHIEGTPAPGQPGNVGLAGHRDGFFRPLQSLVAGARIELVTLSGTLDYRVTEIWIVDPTDVGVLAPTAEPAITLVTCYPFYFVGHAPQRYIVRAVLEGAAAAAGPADGTAAPAMVVTLPQDSG